MAGLLAQQQPQQAQTQQPPQMQQQPQMVSMEQAKGQMTGMMDRLKRIVLAGQTILYSKQSSGNFLRYLDRGSIPQSVGVIVAMVMAALIDKGRDKAVPPNLVMAAGAMIVADLLDYACKLYDVEMTEELGQQALQAFAKAMQEGVQGANPQQAQPQTQQPQDQFAQVA